jgi:hypothetical protein
MQPQHHQVFVFGGHHERSGNRRKDFVALAALAVTMAILCAITWKKWGELTVDSPNEWFIAASLSRGQRLYFDLWYRYGPLVPYWHALFFRAFGIHLWILETIGISIVSITTLTLYSLSRVFLPPSLSFVAGFAFLIQAFQPDEFNYVLPYSYPAAYGAMLFVILAWLLVRDTRDPKPWTFAAAGCIAGLEAINKIEFAPPAFLLLGAAILAGALRFRSPSLLAKGIASCLPGLLVCGAVYGWYIRASSLAFLFGENISILPSSYFMKTVGSQWVVITGLTSASITFRWAAAGLLGPVVTAAAVRFAGISRLTAALSSVAAVLLAGLHFALAPMEAFQKYTPYNPLNIAPVFFFNRGMAFTSAALLVWILSKWRRGARPNDCGLLLLLTAGILMDGRTILQTQPKSFSMFYDPLVFIGYLVAVWKVAGIFHVPASARLWTATAALLCTGLASLAAIRYSPIHSRTFLISSPLGDIYTYPSTGRPFAQALAFLEHAKARSERFAVWPEEVALYYFSGATAPSRWWSLVPGTLPTGEITTRFLDDLDRQDVNYIALSNIRTPEYGVPIFGVHYNQQVYRWLEQNFQVVQTFGDFERAPWAVQIWQRKRSLFGP